MLSECQCVLGLRRADCPLIDPKGLPQDEAREIRDTIRIQQTTTSS